MAEETYLRPGERVPKRAAKDTGLRTFAAAEPTMPAAAAEAHSEDVGEGEGGSLGWSNPDADS